MLLRIFIVVVMLDSITWETLFFANAQENLGSILSGPQSKIVAPEETVYFNCHARGISVYWRINNTIPDPENYEAKGFTFISEDIFAPVPFSNQLGEYNDTIIVEARPSNNNTRFSCRATGLQHGQYDMIEAVLIVVGPPLAPPVNLTQLHLIEDAIQHIIRWTAPFTWSQFPVINYTISINNLHGEYITVVKPSYYFIYIHTTYGKNCYELDFSLAANSQVGQGSMSFIHAGHPVVSNEEMEIETTAAVLSNATVALNISFLVPVICSGYQTATYSILVRDDSSHQLALIGPMLYKQSNDTVNRTFIELEVDLNYTQFYEIEVRFDSNGFIILNNTRIDLELSHTGELHTKTLPEVTNTEDQVTSTGLGQTSTSISPATITLSIVGGMALVAFFIIIITCVSFKRKRCHTMSEPSGHNDYSRQQHQDRPSNLKLQACNPIYEGPVYETMPGESFKALLSPTSPPACATPAADSATRYIFDTDMLPNLPPPRKESAGQIPKLDSVNEKMSLNGNELPTLVLNDAAEYMVMQTTSSISKEANTSSSV